MLVKKVELKFIEPFEELQTITNLVIHHTSRTNMDVYDAHEFHQKERGWSGIGYNFFIEKNGDVIEGRGFNVGAHVYGYNRTTLGICLTGDFEIEHPTDKQYTNAVKFCYQLLQKYTLKVDAIVGHRDLDHKTVCPGKYFDMAQFRNDVKTYATTIPKEFN